MLRKLLSIALLLGVFSSPLNFTFAQTAKPFDLVIVNARIVDGTGNPWFRGDIGIKNGKIAKVGRTDLSAAKQTIDAQNKIVAPGFIDVHAHVEGIYDNPTAENFVRMDVTSLVTGNCGSSTTDVKGFLGKIGQTPLAVNLGTLIAHGSVRAKILGLDDRAPSADEQLEDLKKKDFKDYSFAYVTSYRAKPEFNGKNIAEITKIAKGKNKLDAQIEQILEMYAAGGAAMVYRVMSETDVQDIMRQPFTMIASDSGVREFGAGVPHPRGYGNNARVLGNYVRELKIITLEDAIRKMTSLPAQTFNLRDRGLIREGFAADLVIFDDAKVADKATFENPHQYAEGFQTVIVNGEIVFDGNQMTGKKAGQSLAGNNF